MFSGCFLRVKVENPAKGRILVDVSWHFVSTWSFSDHQPLAKMVPEHNRTWTEINIRYLTDETRFFGKKPTFPPLAWRASPRNTWGMEPCVDNSNCAAFNSGEVWKFPRGGRFFQSQKNTQRSKIFCKLNMFSSWFSHIFSHIPWHCLIS